MESFQQMTLNLVHPSHSSDEQYFDGISTIMVATMQEGKDKILQMESDMQETKNKYLQMEYVYCSKLYPHIQLMVRNKVSEAQGIAELAFKEKENNLRLHIAKLRNENQQFLEELLNLKKVVESKVSIIYGYENKIKGLEENGSMLKSLEIENEELRVDLMNKSRELDELKKHEEKVRELNLEIRSMQKKVDELQSALGEKCAEVDKGKEVQGNLLKKVEFQSLEIMNSEQLLNKRDTENKLLEQKMKELVYRANELQKELDCRNSELVDGRKVQMQLLKQIDSSNFEKFAEYEKEKKMLLGKQRDLEEKVDKLQRSLKERSNESSELLEKNEKLKQLFEARELKLKSAYKQGLDRYKELKAEYTTLLEKHGYTLETATPFKKIEDNSEAIITDPLPVSSKGINHKTLKSVFLKNGDLKSEGKQDILEDNKENRPRPSPVSPHVSNVLISPKLPASSKSSLPAGTKRPASHWRDTRSHKSRVGPDLHDDFLDTPLENARGNMSKVMKKQQQDLDNNDIEDSDDETQDMNVDPGPGLKREMLSKPGSSGFKYVEPVRKKMERDNLKGVECKQCKKFYDAVLPQADGNKQNVRCEHHEGVSRHRYRYAPPSTPEGFWDIGFESEM